MQITLLLLINIYRVILGITPMEENAVLNIRAQERAEYICATDNFNHNGWVFFLYGIDFDYAGENLTRGFQDDISAFIGLKSSPKHNENMINKNYGHIGIGRACNVTVELFTN